MRLLSRALALSSALLLASCVSVAPPGTAFTSEPPGARVNVDGRDSGWVTPCMLALDDEETHVVRLELAGYGAREVVLVPDRRRMIVNWQHGVNGVKSNVRFPLLLPVGDLFVPFREVRTLAPGRVFIRLHPESAP